MLIGTGMKESGLMTCRKVLASIGSLVESIMKDTGKQGRDMAMGYTLNCQEIGMKVNGRTTRKKDQEHSTIKMEELSKDNINMEC
jgi:hypothetical protein